MRALISCQLKTEDYPKSFQTPCCHSGIFLLSLILVSNFETLNLILLDKNVDIFYYFSRSLFVKPDFGCDCHYIINCWFPIIVDSRCMEPIKSAARQKVISRGNSPFAIN